MLVQNLPRYTSAFIELFFPRICALCGNHLFEREDAICKSCLRRLPKTGFEENPFHNPMNQLLWGRAKVETAFALYYYRKGESVQQLLHLLKYKGYTDVGVELGRKLGQALKSGKFPVFDLIVPVPLHPKKMRIRGYNQSEVIAKGISEILKIPVDPVNLHRRKHTATQTKKGRFERWENVEGIFDLHDPQKYLGCHVLVVDDVTTTGATLEACLQPLNQVPYAKASIATIGCTYL